MIDYDDFDEDFEDEDDELDAYEKALKEEGEREHYETDLMNHGLDNYDDDDDEEGMDEDDYDDEDEYADERSGFHINDSLRYTDDGEWEYPDDNFEL